MVRLNQFNLQYAIECDLEILLQGQVIHNWKRKYSISRHALIFVGTEPVEDNHMPLYELHI